MVNARIDTTMGLDGHPVVLACFDLTEHQASAAAHAVGAVRAERYRTAAMGTDDVLAMRELTAVADELADLAARAAAGSVVLAPARLTALRNAVEAFVVSRDEADWLREEDREPLAVVRAVLWPLADLCEDALRAALAAADATHAG
jgi:hypothetical protein